MDIATLLAIILTLSAAFSYINYRFIGLPTTIGVMLVALVCSMVMILLDVFDIVHIRTQAESMLSRIDFNKALMHGMLSFLLFAGSLHISIEDLADLKWPVGLLATVGVTISTFIVGTLTFLLLSLLDLDLPYIYCLLFGALISPTDPIAVTAALRQAKISRRLETTIAGESLFNDGVAVVLFAVILGLATRGGEVDAGEITLLFLQEAGGGILFGFALGMLGYYLLKTIDNYSVEILITLALVMGGYTLAQHIHTSGPVAVVVAGLLIGNRGRRHAMSTTTREHLDDFWELLDEILNIVLFVLIGLEVLVIDFDNRYVLVAILAIPLVLLSRFTAVSLPIRLLDKLKRGSLDPRVITILAWGGLRGGISVALALSLPPGNGRALFLVMTYIIVIFSIVVQGLTLARVAKNVTADKGSPGGNQ